MFRFFVVANSMFLASEWFHVEGKETPSLICKGLKYFLNVSLKGLVFKAKIKGFKVTANRYKILRLGKRIYLMLIWVGVNFFPLGGSNAVMKFTTTRGVKHASAENTVTATVLAARISLDRRFDTASSSTRILRNWLREMVKIHACVKSIIPLGKRTVNDIKKRKWGIMDFNWRWVGITLFWMQPYISWSSILPCFGSMRRKKPGIAPPIPPAIQTIVIITRVLLFVIIVEYLQVRISELKSSLTVLISMGRLITTGQELVISTFSYTRNTHSYLPHLPLLSPVDCFTT